MEKAIEHEVKSVLERHNALHCWQAVRAAIRPGLVKQMYDELRASGVSGVNAKQQLAEHFKVGVKAIEKDLYQRTKTHP